MDSLLDSAASGHPCLPNGNEMTRILDTMEKLGTVLEESRYEKVDTFLHRFEELTSWKYSRGESESTRQQHGTHRWFNHQGENQMCQRQLTKPSEEHSAQVYFDKEPGLGLAVSPTWAHPCPSRTAPETPLTNMTDADLKSIKRTPQNAKGRNGLPAVLLKTEDQAVSTKKRQDSKQLMKLASL